MRGSEDRLPGSAASLTALLRHVADRPVPLARLAQLLLAKGQGDRARELCARAVALEPNNAEVRSLAATIFSHNVPGCYFPNVRDSMRYAAIEAALRRAIRPGFRVLEIGTGTGLLALMAARAGAAEIVTCESNPAVAEAATEVAARNGFADRVRVVAKNAGDLEMGIDLAAPADVLVWDTLANNLIGAGALPIIEQATRHLLKPSAPIIPARGTVRIALAEDMRAELRQMGIVEGFDLSPFSRLAAPSYSVARQQLVLRSGPGDLFQFDFQAGGPFPEAKASAALSATGGLVNGIAQWVRFEMDADHHYENLPHQDGISAFGVVFYPLMRAIEVEQGQSVVVCGAHDRRSLRIWAEVP